MKKQMLMPWPKAMVGIEQASQVNGFDLLKHWQTNKKIFFYLHAQWPKKTLDNELPPGYDLYVVSFHMEQIDYEWLRRQTVGPIVVLSDFQHYPDSPTVPNVTFLRWVYWHHAMDLMMSWFGTEYTKNIQYKASAFCNRVTQSKLVITTALAEYVGREHCLLSLNDWAESQSVHNWEPSGDFIIDHLTSIFKEKYFGQIWSIDDFDNSTQNFQRYTSDPAHPAYQHAALHFNNESFHYSLMVENNQWCTLPGPHLSEKTFKCLLGGTAFITVGQYDCYRTLEDLGMAFDYGLDLSFDQDPGNLSRLTKLVYLVEELQQYTAMDLYEQTRASSEHNQQLIVSKDFYNNCEKINLQSLETLCKMFS